MKLYLAGASLDIELIELWVRRIENETNHTIPYDWTKTVRRQGANNPDWLLPDRKLYSVECLQAAFSADLIWLLMTRTPSIGAYFQVGAAFQDGKQIIVSGDTKRTIFTSLFRHKYTSHEEAFQAIRKLKP